MSRTNKQQLAARLAKQLGLAEAKALSFTDAFIAVITDVLAAGDEVDIADFLQIYAEDAPPRIGRDAKTGETTVLPVSRRVKVKAARAWQETVNARTRFKGAGIVITGADEAFASDLVKRLDSKGVRCFVADNLRKAIKEVLRIKAVDFLVFTPSVPEEVYDASALHVKERRASAFLPVLRGLFDRTRIEKPRGYKIIPDGIFSSPAEVSRQVLSELERWRDEKHYFRRQVRIRAASDAETVGNLVEAVRRLGRAVSRDKTESEKFLNAFPEAIENAAFHGNQASPEKYLDIEWLEDSRRVVMTVKDEGPGFDWEAGMATAAVAAADVVRKHMETGKTTGGLGIKLLLAAFDKVSYQDNGSKIVLTKSKVRSEE